MGTLAWHFLQSNRRMAYKRNEIVRAGQTYRHFYPFKMCKGGLHASVVAMDALEFAPGDTVSRVYCSGRIEHGPGKLVCTSRRVLWIADASEALERFAVWCARQALEASPDPQPASVEAIRTKEAWLDGECDAKRLMAAVKAAKWAEYGFLRKRCPVGEVAARHSTYRVSKLARYAASIPSYALDRLLFGECSYRASYCACRACWEGTWARAGNHEVPIKELERRLEALAP